MNHLVRRPVDAVDQIRRFVQHPIELRPRRVIPKMVVCDRAYLMDFILHLPHPDEEPGICEENDRIWLFLQEELPHHVLIAEPVRWFDDQVGAHCHDIVIVVFDRASENAEAVLSRVDQTLDQPTALRADPTCAKRVVTKH